ncbi:hypothetical protein BHM03_00034690 [Ensete ventricosum]|nr:hypothetical protein BHM03_00034690 [Ensete ventricosum]
METFVTPGLINYHALNYPSVKGTWVPFLFPFPIGRTGVCHRYHGPLDETTILHPPSPPSRRLRSTGIFTASEDRNRKPQPFSLGFRHRFNRLPARSCGIRSRRTVTAFASDPFGRSSRSTGFRCRSHLIPAEYVNSSVSVRIRISDSGWDRLSKIIALASAQSSAHLLRYVLASWILHKGLIRGGGYLM